LVIAGEGTFVRLMRGIGFNIYYTLKYNKYYFWYIRKNICSKIQKDMNFLEKKIKNYEEFSFNYPRVI
jgi:sulfatase maturation enzyme AslB (radical SAM superfamily)